MLVQNVQICSGQTTCKCALVSMYLLYMQMRIGQHASTVHAKCADSSQHTSTVHAKCADSSQHTSTMHAKCTESG